MSRARIATVLAAGLLVALVAGGVSVFASAPANPPSGVNRPGKIVWNFEGLLYRTFQTRDASEIGSSLNFTCPGFCSPPATYNTYVGIFANATRSAYHLSSRRFAAGAFGIYPVPVRIKGHYIACDRAEHRFLIAYARTANFSLDCVTPIG